MSLSFGPIPDAGSVSSRNDAVRLDERRTVADSTATDRDAEPANVRPNVDPAEGPGSLCSGNLCEKSAAAAHQCILVPDWVRRRMLRRSAEGATRVTLDEIKALRLRLAELCQRYGIAELSVFGSVARGDARPNSDVDLLYVRVPGNDLGMSYFALQDDLEKLFGRPVDLVPKEGLHRVIRDQVLADAQILYAA